MTFQRRKMLSFQRQQARPGTTSTNGSSRLSTPRSIRLSTALLRKWTLLSAHVAMLILTRPEIIQTVVDRFADLLDRLDHLI